MLKLLNAYRINNTIKNARTLVAYGRKHPFSLCWLSPEDVELLANAQRHVERKGSC